MGSTDTGNIRLTELVDWLPKQLIAWDALGTHRYILYGGARGPGKSYWLRWSLLLWLLFLYFKYKLENVHVGLFCETYPELRDRQISKIKTEFPLWLGQVKTTQEDGLGFHLHKQYGGGVLVLRNLDDPTKYQSAEFAAIGVDELTQTTYDTFNILRGSLRWPEVPRTVFLSASNPGGIGHGWVKQLWIDRDYPEELHDRRQEFKFIKALPKDNPHLSDEYWDELNSLPEPLRKAWVDGNWDVFAGMAFPAWSRARHIIEPFEIPDWWPRYCGIDWGYAKPWACLWVAKDPDTGRYYVYREAYYTEKTDRQQAQMIVDRTPHKEHVTTYYADPSMWAKKNMEGKVSSTADEYRAKGILLTRADNDRLSGKRKIDRLLSNLPDGKPGMQIFSSCPNLNRTLPGLPYAKAGNPEDVDTHAEDHGYDALRYAVSTAKDEKKKDTTQRSKSPAMEMSVL